MNWVLQEGVIIGIDGEQRIIPTVAELFDAGSSIVVGGQEYPFTIESLRFSKLIAVNVELSFALDGSEITSSLCASQNGSLYPIAEDNGRMLGYCVYNGVWHYLSSDYDVIIDAFASENCSPNRAINYFQYIAITKRLKENKIYFRDEVLPKIKELKTIVHDIGAKALDDILFPYQKIGANWLNFMSEGNCGCILGDEMGLGKTLQIIALFAIRKRQMPDSKFLVVAPVSLLVNWKREIEKFCPSLKPFIHHGGNRTGFYSELLNYDVVITSYSNVQSDLSMFNMIHWDMLIIDEAQNIKNPGAKRRKYLNEINRRISIEMTGTPFENHVTDIWSLSDFVIPGYLGSLSEFKSLFDDSIVSAHEIEQLLSPIMIRRKVADVAKDLPEKVEIAQPLEMTEEEANYYENERNAFSGTAALNQVRIELIQGLRMFCSHPQVYRDDLTEEDPANISTKYLRTCEILEEVFSYGEKALVFTSFNKMIDIFCLDIPRRFNGVPVMFINGSVGSEERQQKIDQFSKIDGPALMVLNPKAAGAGLNITCANHVIHYNLEWNPAVEDQASARAYRRGQEKTVFIYRLYYIGTIEEFINYKIEHKQQIFDAAVKGNKGETNSSDLIKALNYSPRKDMIL